MDFLLGVFLCLCDDFLFERRLRYYCRYFWKYAFGTLTSHAHMVELRENRMKARDELDNSCFICSIERDTFIHSAQGMLNCDLVVDE